MYNKTSPYQFHKEVLYVYHFFSLKPTIMEASFFGMLASELRTGIMGALQFGQLKFIQIRLVLELPLK